MTDKLAAQIDHHRRAIRANPRDARAHAMLGVALLKRDRLQDGVASLQRALELQPGLADLHQVLAGGLSALGQHEAAADSFRRALQFQAQDAALHKGLSVVLRELEQFDAALASARRAAELRPDDANMLLCVAAAENGLGDVEATAATLRRVCELAPGHADAAYDLGTTLMRLKQFEEAAACFRRLLELKPGHQEGTLRLAFCLLELKQLEAAETSYRQALALAPDHPAALRELALVLKKLQRPEEAFALLERVLALNPDDADAQRYLSTVCFDLNDWRQGLHWGHLALAHSAEPASTHSAMLFMLSHACNDPEVLLAEHRKFAERWEAPCLPQRTPHANDRHPQRTLQVGFVSGDFFNHAVASFIEPILDVLKHSNQVCLHAYSNSRKEDSHTQRLRAHFAHWHLVAGLDDDTVERQIRADGIDILIDLSGHTANNRLPLLARKPAPIQATWIGYACTTGMQAIDYFLADQFLRPMGRFDDQFTEQIVRMPLAMPFAPDPHAPAVNELPALANGYLTFGSFHRANKLSREVIAHWAHLLRSVPDSKLLLGGMTPGADTRLLAWFEEEGIARGRLLLRPRVGMGEYLKMHHEVDVCLSPFPYTGATTVSHALWMGVPTLTTLGPTAPNQGAAWVLAHLGLSSFIADDAKAYAALGQFLATNPAALASLRSTMRERFANSLLGYPGVTAAGVELALRQMWQRWCAGQPAAPIEVRLADLSDEEEAA